LVPNVWYHVAYVYNYDTRTQSLYLQGALEASRGSAGPYMGSSGSMLIGNSHLPSSGFTGMIDSVKLTTRAKTAAEILDAGTLVTYFSFDGTSIGQDMGPNNMNGTVRNAGPASGKIGQGIAFSGVASSHLSIPGYYQLGRSNQPFSFLMWIFPYSAAGGVLIQKTLLENATGGWCYSMMGLNGLGQVIMIAHNTGPPYVAGPIVSVQVWTHLGFTYSQTNGIRMYINGSFWGTGGPSVWSSSNGIDWLSIGGWTNYYCGPGALPGTPYQGVIDEFYVYRRELNASEIAALGTP
jgi:hypothetical protein